MRESVLATPERNLVLLEAVVRDGGRSSVAALAREMQISVASAHRHIAALVSAGYLIRAGYGRHLPGLKLRTLAALMDEKQLLANAAAPTLERLALRTGNVVQLGIFENDMVTYLVKTGQSAGDLFTKVGMQLEAYCSGLGKVLLANLPAQVQSDYLAGWPFIGLTERTITDPELLKMELEEVMLNGFAVDDEEVVVGLQCLAVPITNSKGEVIAAISASRATRDDGWRWQDKHLSMLRAAASEIGSSVYASLHGP